MWVTPNSNSSRAVSFYAAGNFVGLKVIVAAWPHEVPTDGVSDFVGAFATVVVTFV